MGVCYSCGKSKDKFKAKICSQIHSAVSPVHLSSHEATCSNYINGHGQYLVHNSSGDDRMATSFPNMNITNPIKGLVSKKRNRYKKDGFNLDLTYITENIIAMGYPASNIEGVYRNHIDDVVKFLDTKHKDHYYIYNLCSERSYDKSKFHNRVQEFPFDDHNPPKIESIEPFCSDVEKWLGEDKRNVAVVHCKAGKGRTGTMICCYLLHSKMFDSAEKALSFYGQTRTQDKKGVTIPSQVRYVQYYEMLLRQNVSYTPLCMYIKEFQLQPPPNVAGSQSCILYSISHQTVEPDGSHKCKKLKDDVCELKKGVTTPLIIKLNYCLRLTGDIKVEFFQKTKIRAEKLFQFWFNTFFVTDKVNTNGFLDHSDDVYQLCFHKNQLDIVNKKDKQNKQFSADFKLIVILERISKSEGCPPPTYIREATCPIVQDTPSDTSESSDDFTNDEDDWDSEHRGCDTVVKLF